MRKEGRSMKDSHRAMIGRIKKKGEGNSTGTGKKPEGKGEWMVLGDSYGDCDWHNWGGKGGEIM